MSDLLVDPEAHTSLGHYYSSLSQRHGCIIGTDHIIRITDMFASMSY